MQGSKKALIFILCLIVVPMVFLSGCSKDKLTDSEYIQKAKDDMDEGKYRDGVIELKNALQVNPENPEARWLLGEIYLIVGDGFSAEKELRHAVKLGIDRREIILSLSQAMLMQGAFEQVLSEIEPKSVSVKSVAAKLYAMRAQAYVGLNKYQKAKSELEKGIKIDPKAMLVMIGRAQLAMSRRDEKSARKFLGQALSQYPESPEAWRLLGSLERSLAKIAPAEVAYSKAIELQYNNGVDYLNRAMLRVSLKDYVGAEEDVAAAEKIVQGHPGVSYVNGVLKFYKEQYSEALTFFESAIKFDEKYMPAIFYLGITHFKLKNYQQAEVYLGQFLNDNPKFNTARYFLSAVLYQDKSYSKAKEKLMPLLAADPENSQALLLMGNISFALGEAKEGIEYFRKSVEVKPENAESRVKLGMGLLLVDENLQEGAEQIEKALELDSTIFQADIVLALSHMKAGSIDDAIQVAEKFKIRQPESAMPSNLLGVIYLAAGDEVKAKKSFEEAVAFAPNDIAGMQNLAELSFRAKDLDRAGKLFQDVLEKDQGHLQALLRMADIEALRGQLSKSRLWLEKAVKENASALVPRLRLGRIFINEGRPLKAIMMLREIHEYYSAEPKFLQIFGEAQLASGNVELAVNIFKNLVKLQPDSADAHFYLANAFSFQKQFVASKNELKRALQLNPDHVRAQIAMLRMTVLDDRLDDAENMIAEMKKKNFQNIDLLLYEGLLRTQNRQFSKAINLYLQALDVSPRKSEAILGLAEALWVSGDRAQSLSKLEEWMKGNSSDVNVLSRLASLYVILGESSKAKTAYQSLIELMPDNAQAMNDLALLLESEDLDQSLIYAEKALNLSPESPDFMVTWGILLLKKAKFGQALGLFDKAIKLRPSDASLLYYRAEALLGNGEEERARAILERLLSNGEAFKEQVKARSLLDQI